MSVTCSNGHENLDGMTFCEDCGVELTAITNSTPAASVPDPPEPPSRPVEAPDPSAAPFPNPISVQSPEVASNAPIAALSPVQTLVPEQSPAITPDPLSPPVAPSGGAYLEITSGPFIGRTFVVTEPICVIGRWDMDSAAFPQIDLTEVDTDAKISRKHARISKDGDRYLLEDLGSLNGTSHAGSARLVPGDQRQLNSGDNVIVGRLFMQFKVT